MRKMIEFWKHSFTANILTVGYIYMCVCIYLYILIWNGHLENWRATGYISVFQETNLEYTVTSTSHQSSVFGGWKCLKIKAYFLASISMAQGKGNGLCTWRNCSEWTVNSILVIILFLGAKKGLSRDKQWRDDKMDIIVIGKSFLSRFWKKEENKEQK